MTYWYCRDVVFILLAWYYRSMKENCHYFSNIIMPNVGGDHPTPTPLKLASGVMA